MGRVIVGHSLGGEAIECDELPPAINAEDACMGGRVWEAVPTMCRFLAEQTQISGMRILELGAGTGACGLFAAGLGAEVVLTEGGPDADALLRLLESNCDLNRRKLPANASLTVRKVDWGCSLTELPTEESFNLIIGSDIVWGSDFDCHAALCDTLHKMLSEDGKRSAPASRQTSVVLAMAHGLPVAPADFVEEQERGFLDETLVQLGDAASVHNLGLKPYPCDDLSCPAGGKAL
jgi:hypothetical protein